MSGERVNYDYIAPTYDRRYQINKLTGIAESLMSLARAHSLKRVLEVGCGSGRWLAELQGIAPEIYGLDLSSGMLRQASQQAGGLRLTCGRAEQLPFPTAAFGLVFCVNAIHHFDDQSAFVTEARRLLRSGGALAIVNMDPNRGRKRWYLYQYFEGTHETDLRRFPSTGTLLEWMIAAGFDQVEWRVAERVSHSLVGREVLDDYFLQKTSTSQLTLLTDEAYAAGLGRIRAALAEAEAAGERLVFPVDIIFPILIGRLH